MCGKDIIAIIIYNWSHLLNTYDGGTTWGQQGTMIKTTNTESMCSHLGLDSADYQLLISLDRHFSICRMGAKAKVYSLQHRQTK